MFKLTFITQEVAGMEQNIARSIENDAQPLDPSLLLEGEIMVDYEVTISVKRFPLSNPNKASKPEI